MNGIALVGHALVQRTNPIAGRSRSNQGGPTTTRRITVLKAKYHNKLNSQRPEQVDEPSWAVFVAAVRDGHTLREISGTTGLSGFKLSQIIARVDHELDPNSASSATHRVTIDSPIEDLNLSTRARNALRQVGCITIRHILDRDFSRAVRSFGAGTRHEVANTLLDHGFVPPPALDYQQSNVESIARDLGRLRQTIEHRYRSSLEHLARLEDSIRKLANGSRTSQDEQRGSNLRGRIRNPDPAEPQH